MSTSYLPATTEQLDNALEAETPSETISIYYRILENPSSSPDALRIKEQICDPPVSVYKGYALPKDTEEYLVSRGLKDALYTFKASNPMEDLFSSLTPCPIQFSCTIEFDGASKGNPSPAGAGAIVRSPDGTVICRLREGLGMATCNTAKYRAVILGLRYALQNGYTNVHVQGDSKLVCMQIDGSWKARSENVLNLYNETKELKNEFRSFHISHVLKGEAKNTDSVPDEVIEAKGDSEMITRNCEHSAVFSSLPLAIKWLTDSVRQNNSVRVQVLVTGSLHLIGDVLKLIKK